MIERSLSRLKSSKRLITFLCGSAGPLALGAVIHHLHFKQEKSFSMITESVASTFKTLINFYWAIAVHCIQYVWSKACAHYRFTYARKTLTVPMNYFMEELAIFTLCFSLTIMFPRRRMKRVSSSR